MTFSSSFFKVMVSVKFFIKRGYFNLLIYFTFILRHFIQLMKVFSVIVEQKKKNSINWICHNFTLALRSVMLCETCLSSFPELLMEISLWKWVISVVTFLLVTCSFWFKPRQQRRIFAWKLSRKMQALLNLLQRHTACFAGFGVLLSQAGPITTNSLF